LIDAENAAKVLLANPDLPLYQPLQAQRELKELTRTRMRLSQQLTANRMALKDLEPATPAGQALSRLLEVLQRELRKGSWQNETVALGTCGTAAGLAAGLGLKDTSIPVTAVKVAPWPYATERMVRKRTNALVQRLQPSGIAAPVIHEAGFYAGGYGIPGAAGLEAIDIARRDGLDLDPTYAAKAFAALVAEARARPGGPFLFLHTSPGPLPQ
jgi:1-aminocyclopropane-1-carboxylate deaminase/D-cysteine desulfhydrase-like pyridoxal-dependent ACC family enzyme